MQVANNSTELALKLNSLAGSVLALPEALSLSTEERQQLESNINRAVSGNFTANFAITVSSADTKLEGAKMDLTAQQVYHN